MAICDYIQKPCIKSSGCSRECVVFKKSDEVLIPDIKTKIEEYIGELNHEIDRCVLWIEKNMGDEACRVTVMESRIETLTEVRNDLQSRLEEII